MLYIRNNRRRTKSIQLWTDKSTCGAGIIVRKNNIIDFKPISERICKITIEMNDIKCNIISAYAPTSERTKKHPEETRKFYELLSDVINKTKTI